MDEYKNNFRIATTLGESWDSNALSMNNVYVLNDKLFRAKSITIMGKKVKFYKLSPKMFSFGIVKKGVNYSDSEKTLLDLLYLKHYTKEEFEELVEELSKTKLLKYAKNYNKRIINIVKELK